MRLKVWKSLSKFWRLYIFLLSLQVASPNSAAYALTSLQECAKSPDCAELEGVALKSAVTAPTSAGEATTVTTSTGAEITAAGRAVIVGTGAAVGVATWYFWSQPLNDEAQALARQKYCAANPNDAVCLPPFTGGQELFTPYYVTVEINLDGSKFQETYTAFGPIRDARIAQGDCSDWGGGWCRISRQLLSGGPVNGWDAPRAEPYWREFNEHYGHVEHPLIRIVKVTRQDGQPDTGGDPPPKDWKDWPQEKRDAAVALLTPTDWQAYIPYLPKGGTLQPGDTINASKIVIPGQETDDPNTPEDERKPRILTQPYTWPGGQPLPSPSPESSPEPSPSPDPSPSPSPSPKAPTASGGDQSTNPSPNSSDGEPKITDGHIPDGVRDDAYTESRHTIDGKQVQRDLRRGREAHVFLKDVELSNLEEKVRQEGVYQGEVRGWYRWTYTSDTPIGVRIQKGRDDVPLNVVELKGRFRSDGTFEYHLVPRARPAE